MCRRPSHEMSDQRTVFFVCQSIAQLILLQELCITKRKPLYIHCTMLLILAASLLFYSICVSACCFVVAVVALCGLLNDRNVTHRPGKTGSVVGLYWWARICYIYIYQRPLCADSILLSAGFCVCLFAFIRCVNEIFYLFI